MLRNCGRTKRTLGVFLVIMTLTSLFALSTYGFSGGRYDRAKTGCECHSLTPDPGVTVSILSLPVEYTPLSFYPLTIDVSGGAITNKGGFNLQVSAGTLSSSDSNVQVNGTQDQATHTNPDQRTWSVDWTAPASGTGDVTFWLAGNAVNGDGGAGAPDGWNLFSQVLPEAAAGDSQPPEISNVLIEGVTAISVSEGAVVTLTATIDDSNSGNSKIAGANYTLGQGNWETMVSLDPVSAPFDNPSEEVTRTIDTTGWSTGTYELYVYGWDETPNYNISSTGFVTLIISTEGEPPEISNVMINGATAQSYGLSSIPQLILSASVDDTQAGGSDVGGANYTIGAKNFDNSQSMILQNPPTSPSEVFVATITPPTEAGTYEFYVYAWDSELNLNITNIAQFATLTLTDDLPPEISSVHIDGSNSIGVVQGTHLTLTATIDDSNSGNSNIAGANFTIGRSNWSSAVSMDAVLSPYNEPSEVVTASVDTTEWNPGTYKLYVYAWDDAHPQKNYNTVSSLFAEVVIIDSPTNIQINTPTEEGKLTISWNYGQSDFIGGFKVYRSATSGSGFEEIATLDPSVISYTDPNLDDETTYYYKISAIDSKGGETSQSEEASATTLPSKEAESDEEGGILWLILFLIVIIVIIIILVLLIRKRD